MEIIKCNDGDFVWVQLNKNDNLNTILNKFSISVNAIVRNNSSVDFYEGEVIKIMKKYNILHVVKPMETLETIANKYNTTIENLAKQNALTSKRLFIGQTLIVNNSGYLKLDN